MSKLEKEVQSEIVKRYKADGYLVIKISLCNMAGFPDLMALKNGQATFIEVKRKGEKPRALQRFVHEILREKGFEVLILDE
jgi:Holliday junction resolvase